MNQHIFQHRSNIESHKSSFSKENLTCVAMEGEEGEMQGILTCLFLCESLSPYLSSLF